MIEEGKIGFQGRLVPHQFASHKEPLRTVRELKRGQMQVELPDQLPGETLSANNPHWTQLSHPLLIQIPS